VTLDAVLGHAATVAQLQRRVLESRLGHALLLTGPDGVGKTCIAMGLAGTLLGSESWPGPLASHPDLWLEDGDGERIGIDRIRAAGDLSLQRFLALRPYANGPRVAILARADRLTDQAANALLKCLEEPPPATSLLLTAAAPERLPPTILSRCQQIALGPVPESEIAAWLDTTGVPASIAEVCARLAAGRPGRARRLANDPSSLSAELAALNRFLAVGGGGVGGVIAAAVELVGTAAGADARESLLVQLAVWASFCRDAACYAAGAPELARWTSHRPALEAWASALSPGRAGEILELVLRAAGDIAAYANPRLTVEVLLLDIFAAAEHPPSVEVEIDALPPSRQRGRPNARAPRS